MRSRQLKIRGEDFNSKKDFLRENPRRYMESYKKIEKFLDG